jgi:AhpD family alkylhydroperoxidase
MERFDYAKVAPGTYHAMLGLEHYLHESGMEESLLHLIKLRASQINGCAYCLDMHWKDLKSIGEPDHRLYELNAWEETSFYTDRERAALAWTEAVTRVAAGSGAGPLICVRKSATAAVRAVARSIPCARGLAGLSLAPRFRSSGNVRRNRSSLACKRLHTGCAIRLQSPRTSA